MTLVFFCAANAQTTQKKPRVPPGRDPGGIAVAIIGAGVDYRRPGIHRRLARDGEGEMIGWDLIDNDPAPFETAPPPGFRIPAHAGSAMAELLLREAPLSRLIAVRSPDTLAAPIGAALTFTRATPARIAVLLVDDPPPDAAKQFQAFAIASPQLLLILPSPTADRLALNIKLSEATNIVRVGAATVEGSGIPTAAAANESSADIAVALPAGLTQSIQSAISDPGGAAANAAAVRLAALAARILQIEPKLDGQALRQRIASLASPAQPSALPARQPVVLLEDIERLPAP